jgi:hypothetical protein
MSSVRQDKGAKRLLRGLKVPDEVSEARREHRPGELGKSPVKTSKRSMIGLETAYNLGQSRFVGAAF